MKIRFKLKRNFRFIFQVIIFLTLQNAFVKTYSLPPSFDFSMEYIKGILPLIENQDIYNLKELIDRIHKGLKSKDSLNLSPFDLVDIKSFLYVGKDELLFDLKRIFFNPPDLLMYAEKVKQKKTRNIAGGSSKYERALASLGDFSRLEMDFEDERVREGLSQIAGFILLMSIDLEFYNRLNDEMYNNKGIIEKKNKGPTDSITIRRTYRLMQRIEKVIEALNLEINRRKAICSWFF